MTLIKITDKKYNFISLYKSPSQSINEFKSFADNLQHNLGSVAIRNPYLIGDQFFGDFNPQAKRWYPQDKTYKGTKIGGITFQFELEQRIHEPTLIIRERSFSVYLPSKTNWEMESDLQTNPLYIKTAISK